MIRGPCPQCHKRFDSPEKRKYCSASCFIASRRPKGAPLSAGERPAAGAYALVGGERAPVRVTDAERAKARYAAFWADAWAALLAHPPCKRVSFASENSHPGPHRRGY
jgi:hypothetical protein